MSLQHDTAKNKLLKHVRGAFNRPRTRAATAQAGKVPKTPTREAKKIKTKDRRIGPDSDEIKPGQQSSDIFFTPITTAMEVLSGTHGADALVDNRMSEKYTATAEDLEKYTPEGAKYAREMNKFEDVFRAPSSPAGNGTASAPFEVFDIAPARPLRFWGRRGPGKGKEAPCSPMRRRRPQRDTALEKWLDDRKRKREVIEGGATRVDKESKEREEERKKRPKLMLKLSNPDKPQKQGS